MTAKKIRCANCGYESEEINEFVLVGEPENEDSYFLCAKCNTSKTT